jgi:hypothetical protein
MRVTCGSECCFWLRCFFRVSEVPARMCLGSCIPYTCLFINYQPFDDKQLEIVGGVNELMNHSVVISLPDCTQLQVSCCVWRNDFSFKLRSTSCHWDALVIWLLSFGTVDIISSHFRALKPTKVIFNRYRGTFSGIERLRLRMSGSLPSLSLYAFMACTGTSFMCSECRDVVTRIHTKPLVITNSDGLVF